MLCGFCNGWEGDGVEEWPLSHKEVLPLQSHGPAFAVGAASPASPRSGQLIATSHVVLGSQGIRAKVERRAVPWWAHFHHP